MKNFFLLSFSFNFIFTVKIQTVNFDNNFSGWVRRSHEISHLFPTYLVIFPLSTHSSLATDITHAISYIWIVTSYLWKAEIFTDWKLFSKQLIEINFCSNIRDVFYSPWLRSKARHSCLLIFPSIFDWNPQSSQCLILMIKYNLAWLRITLL